MLCLWAAIRLPLIHATAKGATQEDIMSSEFRIRTTSDSIVIEANGEHIAEYASKAPKADAASMRRQIKAHLAQPGSTLHNYQW